MYLCRMCCNDYNPFFYEREHDSDEDLDNEDSPEDEDIPEPNLPENRSLEEEYPNLAPLFASNDVPKAAHASVVQEILRDRNATLSAVKTKLSEIRSEVSRLNSIIRRLKRQRSGLYDQKRSLRKEIHQCEGVIAPIRRLPPEVLSEIFSYFTPVLAHDHRFDLAEHNYRNTGYMMPDIPWYLGQICSYWRTVALSTRSLWTVFDLRPISHRYYSSCRVYSTEYTSSGRPIFYRLDEEREIWLREPASLEAQRFLCASSYEEEVKAQVPEDFIYIASCIQPFFDAVEERLQRSGEAPISARVVYQDSPHTIPFFNALLRHSHRLRHLHLVDMPQDILDRFSESCSAYKQMRSLALIFTAGISPQPIFDCPSTIVNLHLTSVFIPTATHSSIPWAQLLKYCEQDCIWDDDDDRWASYRQLSNVIELCVQFDRSAQKPRSPVMFPELRHACLSFQGEEQKDILHSFETPVLESLSYDHRGCFFPQVRIRHSLPYLKTLRVCLTGCSGLFHLDIGCMLEMCPDLTEIFIRTTETRVLDLVRNLLPALRPKIEVVRLGLNFSLHEYDGILEVVRAHFQWDFKSAPRMREMVLYDYRGCFNTDGYDRPRQRREASVSLGGEGFNLNFSVQSNDQGDSDLARSRWSTNLY
ncbi:hypothetical protein C8R45DRAFT_1091879 [Mycena sanguinolenta]|nr:hypothetical protein C8R45DRAFT_1091879 [Mycena sanguinolenta]